MADRAGVLRVGNCSGFYGDRLSAMREMLAGGDLDVLTGDYLAELTMLILGRDRMKDPSLGYARTFVRQLEDCLGLALERGVRIVANAGGLNPAGLAEKVREVATGLGLDPVVAHVEGDDLLDRAAELGLPGKPLTANAYLGGFGIAAALRAGADVVVTGRVTDASLVVGPAVARFGWAPTAYDELAGAVVAGHVLECGTQATGGNFSGFRPWTQPLGFPVAEVAADGSCVITKHPGTGGEVSVDTVTAQLVYEIGSPVYLGPDVATHLDTVSLEQDGPDRVRVSGVRGSAPPDTLKVCVNELGGFRSSAELVLVGLDIEEKAAWVRSQVTAALADPPASVEWTLARTDHEDADTEEGAAARLRVTVRDEDPNRVGKAFTAALVELALASYPGFTLTGPPAPGTPYGVYRPAYVPPVRGPGEWSSSTVPHARVRGWPRRAAGRRCPSRGRVAAGATAPERVGEQVSRLAPLAPQPADAVRLRSHLTNAAGPARHHRPRPVGRQGRRRERRGLGPRRSGGPGRVAAGLPDARAGQDPAAGGGRPRRRGAPAAEPPRGERRPARAARRGRRGVEPVRPAGEGGRRVAAVAVRRGAGGPAVNGFWSAEQVALMESARAFVRAEVVPHLQEWEDAGSVPRELHRKAAKLGFLGLGVPEDLGGAGGTFLDALAVTEAFTEAGASSGLLAALFTSGIALPHIVASGNADLVDRYVRPTLAGETIGSLAVTEPGGGSDVARLRTTAVRDGRRTTSSTAPRRSSPPGCGRTS